MIDWLTLRFPMDSLLEFVREAILGQFPRLMRSRPETEEDEPGARIMYIDPHGEITWNGVAEWDTCARQSLRSDTHRLTVSAGQYLTLSGSPARVVESNNVFGTGDPKEAAGQMIRWAAQALDVALPTEAVQWDCRRMDVTQSYDLGHIGEVRQALDALTYAAGGRYRVKQDEGTVYWNQRSALRSGKAYAKGPHLRRQVRRGEAQAEPGDIELADRLLRLELKLGGQYWRERAPRPWYDWTESDVESAHRAYFEPLVGVEVVTMQDEILRRLVALPAVTEGQARAVYGTYMMCRTLGGSAAREHVARATWFRHQKLLRAVGLSLAEIHQANVVEFRRRPIVLGEPVRSWAELRRRAA